MMFFVFGAWQQWSLLPVECPKAVKILSKFSLCVSWKIIAHRFGLTQGWVNHFWMSYTFNVSSATRLLHNITHPWQMRIWEQPKPNLKQKSYIMSATISNSSDPAPVKRNSIEGSLFIHHKHSCVPISTVCVWHSIFPVKQRPQEIRGETDYMSENS